MKNYKVVSNLRHNGDVYVKGDEVELNEVEAKLLLDAGTVKDLADKGDEPEIKLESRKPADKKEDKSKSKGGNKAGAKPADKKEDKKPSDKKEDEDNLDADGDENKL